MGHGLSHLYYRVRASREVDGALSIATAVREALEPVAADSDMRLMCRVKCTPILNTVVS